MKGNHNVLFLALAVLALPASNSAAEEGGDIAAAVTSGKAHVAIRSRYEHVDADNFDDDADAATTRFRLNYRTGQWSGWSAFGEFDHVFTTFANDFNSGAGTSPNRTRYPVVADPDGSDLNQLYLDYSQADSWKARLGRQRIILDNQRFVGGVGWRQNEQTYDAITLDSKMIPRTAFSYSYVGHVRRIFGEKVAAGSANIDGHLLNAKVTINDDWSVVPYYYYLDYGNGPTATNSTGTFGARLAGNIKVGEGRIALIAELATQSDVADAPIGYDAQYANIGASWIMKNSLTLGIAYEFLGGDTDTGEMFRTPLATLHAFQGWADMFLTTPTAGIEDIYATVKYKAGKWNLTGVYHDFSADATGEDYGNEFDLSAARSFGERYGVLFKGAFFNSDSLSYADTNKFWIMLTANY